jgi:glutathione synthase/RimK-type ligase-like ATP-grasp enzyme
LNSLEVNFSKLPELGKGDLLYNFSRGSSYLESLLINDDVTTYYIKNPVFPFLNSDTLCYTLQHSKHNIPQPKTIFSLTKDKKLLTEYVVYLGGFPIIIKAAGSTRGIGTIKIESWHNLFSTIDYLLIAGGQFIMREFIQSDGVGRCRVLGNEVIQTYEFPLIKNDFRTSSIAFSELEPVKKVVYSKEIEKYCIEAAHLANTESAAVDIMIDPSGNPYILEVNFPAGLPLNWEQSGNIIGLKMIEYLRNKALRNDT